MANRRATRALLFGVAGCVVGIASASESAIAQGMQPNDPGVRGGAPSAGGPLLGLSQKELNFFNAASGDCVVDVAVGLPSPDVQGTNSAARSGSRFLRRKRISPRINR
jgi:hypothetical protein